MARPFTTELTPRQREVLAWVKQFAHRNGMPPTVREIGRAFGITPRAVFDFLKVLERKGCLKRGQLGARSLEVRGERQTTCDHCASVKVIGRIAAGKPIYAHEDDLGAVTVDHGLLKGRDLYALRAQGDSMIEAGILDGDWVVVRKQDHAEDGDIVVALVGNEEGTLKKLYREGDRIRLQPANSHMEPIYVKPDELRIQGKVVGVQRYYGKP